MRSIVARIHPTAPTQYRILNRELVVTQISTIGIRRMTGIVVNLVTILEVAIHMDEDTLPTQLRAQTTGEQRGSFAHSVSQCTVVIIGGCLVAGSIEDIITIRIYAIPERVTISRIDTSPLFEVPSVDILTNLNLLVNRRSLLEELSTLARCRVVTRQAGHAVLVETDIETDIPAPSVEVDYVSIDIELDTTVTNRTGVLHYLVETR